MTILVLNAGSSSLKSHLYQTGSAAATLSADPADPPDPLWTGKIEWTAPAGIQLTAKSAAGATQEETLPPETDERDGLARLLETLWRGSAAVLGGAEEIQAVGHRVVHGGNDFQEPVRITPDVQAAIARWAPVAPEHNPAALAGIESVAALLPAADLPQFAVFDTAFHQTIPTAAAIYPGPYAWAEQNIRRYGFHGINHAWCAERAARFFPERDPATLRLIICHLGNGCSLCAVRGGKSVDTTMGFTPLEGLMMGSRSGSIDPGLLLHLLQKPGGPTATELAHTLNEESGLKGLSGISEDMRAIEAALEQGNPRARLAFEVFIHRLRGGIGAMLASLGGLDALIFTAGIGENSVRVRAAVCDGLGFAGLILDEAGNTSVPRGPEVDIAGADSPARILVVPAQEDWAIARACRRLL